MKAENASCLPQGKTPGAKLRCFLFMKNSQRKHFWVLTDEHSVGHEQSLYSITWFLLLWSLKNYFPGSVGSYSVTKATALAEKHEVPWSGFWVGDVLACYVWNV